MASEGRRSSMPTLPREQHRTPGSPGPGIHHGTHHGGSPEKPFDHGPPGVLYLSFRKRTGASSNKILRYKSKLNGYPYYTNGSDTHIFFTVICSFGIQEPLWVIGRRPPTTRDDGKEPEGLRAKCKCDHKVVPYNGWEYVEGKFGEVDVFLTDSKPADFSDGGESSGKVQQLLAALGKDAKAGDAGINMRDVLRNLDAVEELLPELLTSFPRIDQDGNGIISTQELEAFFEPHLKKERSKAELDEMWKTLTGGSKVLTLRDLGKNYKYVDSRLPELIERFTDLDTDKSGTIDRSEFYAFFGDGDLWLDMKMQGIIGLPELKKQIQNFYWRVKLDRLRRKAGYFVNNDEAIILVFKGNPGVGKTMFGRLIAQLLFKIDIIPSDKFVEAQRDQLVGSHIGETEKKTQELLDQTHGGVLFVDEAYRLNVKDSDKDFGKEAINTLMKAMTVKGKVIVLAGYPREMAEFVAVNPGIQRRITYEFTFDDYTVEDLGQILRLQVQKRGFSIDPSVDTKGLTTVIADGTSPQQRAAMNGGMCEHIARNAVVALNNEEVPRIQAASGEQGETTAPSVILSTRHLLAGCRMVPAVTPTPGPANTRSPEPEVGRPSRPSVRSGRPSTGGGGSTTTTAGSPVSRR